MIPSRLMIPQILCIAGPTASGKSSRAVEEALARRGEIISVDSRQVYRGLDIGTEKTMKEEMRDIPHHLIDIRDPQENYSAGNFVVDATRLITEISARGKLPILVGGTHFYFDALLKGLPMGTGTNLALRIELEEFTTEELYARVRRADARRALDLDPQNRRRLIRALEIIEDKGDVPARTSSALEYEVEWIILDPSREELRARIDVRLQSARERGLVQEVRRVRELVGDVRLNELGLEYRIIGEYLRSDAHLAVSPPSQPSQLGGFTAKLLPTLSAKLWQYARRQKAWLRKLRDENTIP